MGCSSSSPAEAPGGGAPGRPNRGKARRLSVAETAKAMEDAELTVMENGVESGGTGQDGEPWLRYAAVSNAGYSDPTTKKVNQDSCCIVPPDAWGGGKTNQIIFGVFDGHGSAGHKASQFIKKQLQEVVFDELEKVGVKDSEVGTMEAEYPKLTEAWEKIFIRLNDMLEKSPVDVALSGSTAVVVHMNGEECVCANAGDSRAVLGVKKGSGWTSRNLSEDQKPEDPLEKERIEASGGIVKQLWDDEYDEFIGPHRVWSQKYNGQAPGIAMARSLGDTVAGDCGVTPTPVVKHFNLDRSSDKFMISASDGVWEFITSEQGAQLVGSLKDKGNNPKQCAAAICEEALQRWRKEEDVVDDITAVVAFFDNDE